ncbi:hypothetical protein [Occallatibacter riparius]|uniref:Uncharacterized protein n=1 Tax=Occallatibacter riparius TaxID=1002689 RepID=A0A9J7BQC5_9BACT|nr:hypothetical protein [Occallatibacter riparius]UWZ84761.1 hypothetical protein MOP44_02215 [Occallatibacter riparius]
MPVPRSKDYFWRKDFFETLKAVAERAQQVPDWAEYGEFCLEYERGLRSSAFSILNRFLKRFEQRPFQDRKGFVSWLLNIVENAPGRHMLIPHPLQRRLIEPTLLEWTLADPASAEPHRWLGTRDDLEKAVAVDPLDQIAIRRLLRIILGGVDYAVHELPTGYLGNPDQDLIALERSEKLINRLIDPAEKQALLAEVEELRAAVLGFLNR